MYKILKVIEKSHSSDADQVKCGYLQWLNQIELYWIDSIWTITSKRFKRLVKLSIIHTNNVYASTDIDTIYFSCNSNL